MLAELTDREMLKKTAATATALRERFFSRFRPASFPPAPSREARILWTAFRNQRRKRGVERDIASSRKIIAAVVVEEFLRPDAGPTVLYAAMIRPASRKRHTESAV